MLSFFSSLEWLLLTLVLLGLVHVGLLSWHLRLQRVRHEALEARWGSFLKDWQGDVDRVDLMLRSVESRTRKICQELEKSPTAVQPYVPPFSPGQTITRAPSPNGRVVSVGEYLRSEFAYPDPGDAPFRSWEDVRAHGERQRELRRRQEEIEE